MADPSKVLDELERLAKEATPGPWCEHPNGTSVWGGPNWDSVNHQPESPMVAKAASGASTTIERELADMSFIAAADPATVLALVEVARAALNMHPTERTMRMKLAIEKLGGADGE